jgi:hypothetical protein
MKHILPVVLASLLLRQHWQRLISDLLRLGFFALGISSLIWFRSHFWMKRQLQLQSSTISSMRMTSAAAATATTTNHRHHLLLEYSMECDRMKWGISIILFLYLCQYEIREGGYWWEYLFPTRNLDNDDDDDYYYR